MPASYSVDILNTIRDNASDEYQARIPVATQDNISLIGNAMQTYTPLYNEFAEALINKIGRTILESKMMNNRLARFKNGMILSEQDVEEIFIEMSKSEGAYDAQGSNPLGRRNPPPIYAIYHRMNRQDCYVVTVGEVDFVRVFRSPATLDSFIGRLINSVYAGDSYDEWLLMKNLLATYGATVVYKATIPTDNWGDHVYYIRSATQPYTYTQIPQADIDEAIANDQTPFDLGAYYEGLSQDIDTDYQITAYATYDVTPLNKQPNDKQFAVDFVKALRKAVQDMSFPSKDYNAAGVMTYCEPQNMVLLVHKDVTVEVDVEQLATAFHSSETDMKVVPTIITMDDFGLLTDAYALVLDEGFFRVYDTLMRTEPQRNAQGLFTNYFFHHWQILSLSRFKNAAMIRKAIV